MEYVTKKVPRDVVPLITKLQAEYTLEEGRRVTEGEIIREAVRELAHKPVRVKKKYNLADLCGSIKGGPKTNATEELDEVVYGDVNVT